ncbi:hypothetical protein PAPYR_12127 [Paratrimastix pyriformis]|uniref:Uncharacterized protein n=1 Tax=Paratrimastix pyriformis TaxID=342808 RepID=A0ABQ8U2D5_9EUKA|nr:hypothetical protein PAPYR_12127 [Paratrimastix pyriformis]
MPDHCCSAAFCLTEITVPSQPPEYQNSPSHIHIAAIQPTSSLYQPSPLQTLDSIDSRVNSYPFLPYFIHQLTSIDPATPIVPSHHLKMPRSITVPIPSHRSKTHQKCLQRDGPSPYASQKRA